MSRDGSLESDANKTSRVIPQRDDLRLPLRQVNRIFSNTNIQAILDSFVLGVPKYFGEGFLQCASGDAMTRRLLFSVE